MNKKRLTATFLCLLLFGIMGVGTYAYFFAQVETANVITTGSVELEIIETQIDKDGREIPYPEKTITDILPGTDISKIPRIKNTGSAESWIRAKVQVSIHSEDGRKTLPADMISFDFNSSEWINGKDGWYYYRNSVLAQKSTKPLFSTVSFSENMKNEYQSCSVEIKVIGQSVQTKNNEATGNVLKAEGWPADNTR